MARLALAFLGPLQVTLDGAPITTFESDKVRALLVYLAVEADRPHRRATLAGLLWPERPERAAHLNLNQAMSNLRQALHDRTATPPVLQITRESIQFNLTSDDELDVAMFAALLDACAQHPHRHPDTCPACLRRLYQATELYRGDFLAQFFLRDATAFEEWALLIRERLRRRALGALARLANAYERRGEHEQVQSYAWRQLELEPWYEAAHRQVMRGLALGGQHSAALAHYERCRRILAAELGVEPEPETTTLHARLQRGERLELQGAATPPTNLSAYAPRTPFLGREGELAQIADRIEHRDCRLLTLVGLGGSGKTRLALQAAADHLASFADGVYFVPLAPLSAPEFLIPAIADALAFAFHGSSDPATQLLAYLREKEMLLVLDNFEHLLDGADLLSELVQRAPAVRWLVTSRERLNLQVEWILDIVGLPVPQGVDAGAVAVSSAVQLFVQTARRVQAEFALSPETVPDVVRICRWVDGMPLAIELAASWVWTQSCDEIAQELEGSLDVLATELRDVPARHRSMRAVFDHSWKLLSAEEQSVLGASAVFRGGFTRAAAEQVAGASAPLLSRLIAASFLRRDTADRYHLHELVRQYAAEQVQAAGEMEQVRDRHLQYFLALFRQMGETLGIADALSSMAAAMAAQDKPAQAIALIEESLKLKRAVGDKDAIAKSLVDLGYVASLCDDSALARAQYDESLRLFQELGEQRNIAWILTRSGHFALNEREAQRATGFFIDALTLYRELEDPAGIMHSLLGLAEVAVAQRRPERAGRLLGAVEVVSEAGSSGWIATTAPPMTVPSARRAP